MIESYNEIHFTNMTILLTQILETIETGAQAGRFSEGEYLRYSRLLMKMHTGKAELTQQEVNSIADLIDRVKFMHERDIIDKAVLDATQDALVLAYHTHVPEDGAMVTVEDGYEFIVVE